MKIVAVLGSPRNGGSSDTLAEAFLREAEQLGAQIERFRLSKLNYRGCLGCGRCKTDSQECIQRDDLTPVLQAVRQCDALLVASPVYFLDVSSQTKGFIDRCYSFCEPHIVGSPSRSKLPKGKSIVFVVTQGADAESFADLPQRYRFVFDMIGFAPVHVIRGCGLGFKKDAVARREDLLKESRETARKVIQNMKPLEK
ncbi:MAG: flavodoxin family protein [Dehalococcoidia bacterium]|nr:flavodoxin family protein [Dehalococcoidia bacterium]